jgi:hypothetical protein
LVAAVLVVAGNINVYVDIYIRYIYKVGNIIFK